MATLTSSATLTVAAGETVVETAEVTVLPIAGEGEGTGRLVHPTLGSFDYEDAPDRWTSVRGDVVVPPVWAFATALSGAAATLWPGSIEDVVVEETWVDSYAMDSDQLDMLALLFQTPVDPADGYLEWWPSYTTDLGFRVAFLDLQVGGQGLSFTHLLGDGIVEGPVVARFRILGRAT